MEVKVVLKFQWLIVNFQILSTVNDMQTFDVIYVLFHLPNVIFRRLSNRKRIGDFVIINTYETHKSLFLYGIIDNG